MAGVFDIELHDEIVEKDESDDDVIEIEEVSALSLFFFFLNQNNVSSSSPIFHLFVPLLNDSITTCPSFS